jgi:hypothetical protein
VEIVSESVWNSATQSRRNPYGGAEVASVTTIAARSATALR